MVQPLLFIMARTLKSVNKRKRWSGKQEYLIFLGLYLLLGAIVALFMIPQFRHAWMSHRDAPLSEYTISGTDFDVDEYTVKNDEGETETKEDYTYFLKVDVTGREYLVETSYDLYQQIKNNPVSRFETTDDAPRFYYDKRKDQVFLGGYYPPRFHFFLWTFLAGFVLFFVVIPLWPSKRKD